jgi:hypothetical protein
MLIRLGAVAVPASRYNYILQLQHNDAVLALREINKFCNFLNIKGIVSQDWGRLMMVLWEKSEVRTILLDIYFFQSQFCF